MTDAALITGASTGIGRELATLLAARGYHVVLVARDAQKLTELARTLERQFHVKTTVRPHDLTVASAPDDLVTSLASDGLTISLLVNNAGFGIYGPFAESNLQEQLQIIQLNLVALTHLTHRLVPSMLAKRQGRILNVASTAAFQPGPLMAVYYATKAYVLSFSEALANELEGSGVTVTALCPGPTRTPFQDRAGVTTTRLARRSMEARPVAEAGLRGLFTGQPVVVPGLRNRLLALSVRLLPRSVVTRVVRRVQQRRR